MARLSVASCLLYLACLLLLVGAGTARAGSTKPVPDPTALTAPHPDGGATLKPVGLADEPLPDPDVPPAVEAAPAFHLNWYTINSGGATSVASANYQLGFSAGQSAAGYVSGATYKMSVGFWYGIGSAACAITMTGDVDQGGTITAADIIGLVNYVFKGGAAPLPCAAAGDVNCDGTVTASDIIALVNYVFKGGAAPCDVCVLIPGTWSCP